MNEMQLLLDKFKTGAKPTGQDFAELIQLCYNALDMENHKNEVSPHVYGGKFEWRYNEDTRSLDLVVL